MRLRVKTALAFRISAFMGFAGVMLGAIGGHALSEILTSHGTENVWRTASFYHLVHSLVLLFLSWADSFRKGPWVCFLLGILFFSGSLYILAGTGIRGFGGMTPIGGIFFLVGWLWLVISPPKSPLGPKNAP